MKRTSGHFSSLILTGLLLMICLGMIPIAALADTGLTNRNYFYGMDHTGDQAIVDKLLNLTEEDFESAAFPTTDLDRNIYMTDPAYCLTTSNYVNRWYYLHYTRPELVGVYNINAITDMAGSFKRFVAYVRSDLLEVQEAFEARLPEVQAEIDALVPSDATDLQKILIVHDYVAATTAYDKVGANSTCIVYGDYDCYGAFVDHLTVCQGYAIATKYLLNYLGIDCMVATSSGGGHAWNIVKLNGQWYHMDVNSDDMAWDMLGRVDHTCLLRSTASFAGPGANKNDFIVYSDEYNGIYTDDTFCTDTTYDPENSAYFWEEIHSQIYLYDGYYYYMDASGSLCRKEADSDLTTAGEAIYTANERTVWYPFNNAGATFNEPMGRIAGVGDKIYFLTPAHIYAYDIKAATAQIVYTPELSAQEMLIGLAYVDEALYCTINTVQPSEAETWIKVMEIPVPEKQVTYGLIDEADYNKIKDTLSFKMKMGESFTVRTNLPEFTLSTDNASSAVAVEKDGAIHVACLMNGSATIKVNDTYTISVTVEKTYQKVQAVTVEEGGYVDFVDKSGLYAGTYSDFLLNPAVATVSAKNREQKGQAEVPPSGQKLSSFTTGAYRIGCVNGSTIYYLTATGGATSSVENAPEWTVTGSSDAAYLSYGGKYLTHSSSGISLSNSNTDAAWKYGSNGFYFSGTRKILFFNVSTTYYLSYSNGFTVSTSTTYKSGEYKLIPGTPAVEGLRETQIRITGVKKGTTAVLIGETLYQIEVKEKKVVESQTITVKTVDDLGAELAAPYQITGELGTGYSIDPPAIYGYTTPKKVSGTYTKAVSEIKLIYTLNTDKTALKSEIDGKLVNNGEYTEVSYAAYESAVNAGKAVYDKARATQTEVDQALSNISNMKKALKKVVKGYVLDRDGFDSGHEYVILSSDGYAIGAESGSVKAKKLTVTENTISEVSDNYVWIVTKGSSGFNLKNKATGQYLTVNTTKTLRIFTTYSLGLSSSGGEWIASASGNYFRLKSSNRYLKYASSSFSLNSSSASSCNMLLYKK